MFSSLFQQITDYNRSQTTPIPSHETYIEIPNLRLTILTLTPILAPHEFQLFVLGQIFLHGIVDSLDQHVLKAGSLEYVSHCRRMAKRVDGPSHFRLHL